MFNRIVLVVTLAAGLSVAVINFVILKNRISTTVAARNQYQIERNIETAARQKFERLARNTQTQLDQMKNVVTAAVAERDAAVEKAAEQMKLATEVQQSLKRTIKQRDSALDKLAEWESVIIPTPQIKASLSSLKEVTDERDVAVQQNKNLVAVNSRLIKKINALEGDEGFPEGCAWSLPPGLKGQVLVADPRYKFVVLNIGANQGVLEDGKLLVNRNGRLIGKVQVTSVKSDRCIANVVPGWNLSDVREGDQVLF